MTSPTRFLAMTLLAGAMAAPMVIAQTTPGTPPPPTSPTTPPSVVAPPATPPAATPAAPRASVTPQAPHHMRASRIIGATVRNADSRIGRVDDLLLGADNRVERAVISVGGFLGIGDRLVAVPISQLRIDDEEGVTLPGATRESLNAMPEFRYGS